MADQEEIQVIVEDKIFTIPKAILSSYFEYFYTMFNSNFKESRQNSIILKEVDPIAFEYIIEYIQSKSLRIIETVKSALEALKCGSYLQCNEVQNECLKYLTANLRNENCLNIFDIANHLHYKELADAAMTCAAWNCEAIFQTDSSLKEPFEYIDNFLRRPELNVKGNLEWTVWEFIYKWIQEDKEKRKEYLLKLLTCIDYTRLKLSDIDDITNYDIVIDDEGAQEFLNLAKLFEYKLLKNGNPFCTIKCFNEEVVNALENVFFKNSVRRIYHGVPWFAVFEADDSDITGKRLANPLIIFYNIKSNTVTTCLPLLKLNMESTFCVGFRVCSVGYFFYILGGQYQIGSNVWNSDVWSYDTVTEKWEIHEQLPEKRRNHMMCVVDSVIYLIGGYGKHRIALSSMDAYDTKSRKWLKKLPRTPFNESGACCAYNETILVFAGNMLHTYYVSSKQWLSEKISSTEARSYGSALCHKDSIYLLRSYSNEVYRTKPYGNGEVNIEYFGSFQNNTENVCIASDTLFSFTVNDNLKNKKISDTVNIIEVIPLSKESQEKYEHLSLLENCFEQEMDSNSNDSGEVDEDMEVDVEEPEYIKIEQDKLNVEANHSQHSRLKLQEDYFRRKEKHKVWLRGGLDMDYYWYEIFRPLRSEIPADQPLIANSPQQMVSECTSNLGQYSDQLPQSFQYNPQISGTSGKQVTGIDQPSTSSSWVPSLVPKRGIIIWASRMVSKSKLSSIPFITGSSCHGCATLFKLDGTNT